MKLVIGNKNYSSWSMRPWVLLRAFGIPFDEIKLRFDFTPGSRFYTELAAVTPVAKVPVLVEDDGFATWDTLAIAERVADLHPALAIWPREAQQRARARSVCAEMHAGFTRLRNLCPMNIEAYFPELGAKFMAEDEALRRDLARMDALWCGALAGSGGPFLFGEFSAADAYFAPVAIRVTRFALPLSSAAAGYVERLLAHPAVAAWVSDALLEADFIVEDEPHRQTRGA